MSDIEINAETNLNNNRLTIREDSTVTLQTINETFSNYTNSEEELEIPSTGSSSSIVNPDKPKKNFKCYNTKRYNTVIELYGIFLGMFSTVYLCTIHENKLTCIDDWLMLFNLVFLICWFVCLHINLYKKYNHVNLIIHIIIAMLQTVLTITSLVIPSMLKTANNLP